MLVDTAIILSYFVAGVTILVRATREKCVATFSFFYSYLVYFLLTAVADLALRLISFEYFPHFFWLRFLTLVLAEFVLLVEIGDHVFSRFPALQSLSRLVTLGITTIFSIIFILPPLLENRTSEMAIYDLIKRSALTKGVIILILVALTRYFRVPLGRNVGGIALGLMTFLCINTANFALVEHLGWERFGSIFAIVGPLSQTLMMLIWAVSLWKYEPVLLPEPAVREDVRESQEPLPDRLGRYHSTLDRLLRR